METSRLNFFAFKATKGKQTLTFYTLPEYEAWKKELEENGETGWHIKYYKVSNNSRDFT